MVLRSIHRYTVFRLRSKREKWKTYLEMRNLPFKIQKEGDLIFTENIYYLYRRRRNLNLFLITGHSLVLIYVLGVVDCFNLRPGESFHEHDSFMTCTVLLWRRYEDKLIFFFLSLSSITKVNHPSLTQIGTTTELMFALVIGPQQGQGKEYETTKVSTDH